MKLTVFYSWQSDRKSALCRNFIHIALRDAADRLAAKRSVEVVVDSDTQGVPGTPPITAVILEKIAACDVFVADMTFVGETDEPNDAGETKLLPNPNVMGEFGYALNQKGWRRILLVMNEAYGPPKALPFDLGQFRNPATYNVAAEKPDGPRRSARNALSARLEANLEAVLDDILGSAPPKPDLRQPLQDLWIQTQNGRVASNPPCLVSRPSAYVYVVPAAALDPPRLDLKAVQAHRHLLRPAADAQAVVGQDSNQWWEHGPTRRIEGFPNPEAAWCGRLLRPGIVEHIFNLGRPYEGDQEIVVGGFTLEKQIVSIADRALTLLDALGLAGPTLIAVNFHDLDNVHLSGRQEFGRFRQPNLSNPPVMVAAGSLMSGKALRETFDRLWLAAGFSDGSLSFASSDEWAGYAPDSAY
jgi:hypothetical protein